MIKVPTKKQVDAALRYYARSRKQTSCAVESVPPWCFLTTGRSIEQATVVAAREMGITQPAFRLSLFWAMRRIAGGEQ